ncbi:MAG: IS5 family transposase ISBam3 [Burkholderia gladioli]|nr:MAG: IS5 family transposase ISBam3 [Burkholderia gladioli]
MRKDIHKTGKSKTRYRVRNWAAYNEGLINRGNITIWIDKAVLARIPDAIPARGRPCLYGDTLIQALLGVKTVYRLMLPRPARFHPKSARSGLPELAGAELHHALSPGKNA